MEHPIATRVSYWAQQLAAALPRPETVYHSLISCIISQKISFATSRAIRARLYALSGMSKFEHGGIQKLGYQSLMGSGLSPDIANLILSIPAAVRLEDLRSFRGVGNWTVKAVTLMTYSHVDIFLEEDKFVQKRIAQLFGVSQSVDASLWVSQYWAGHRSAECRFLWRLKDSGVTKILAGAPLESADLI